MSQGVHGVEFNPIKSFYSCDETCEQAPIPTGESCSQLLPYHCRLLQTSGGLSSFLSLSAELLLFLAFSIFHFILQNESPEEANLCKPSAVSLGAASSGSLSLDTNDDMT